jgi:hypothetical protein
MLFTKVLEHSKDFITSQKCNNLIAKYYILIIIELFSYRNKTVNFFKTALTYKLLTTH